MRKLPKVKNSAVRRQRSSASRQSESVKQKSRTRTYNRLKSTVKPTKRLRFYRLAIQLFELFDLATSGKQRFEKQAAGRLLAQLHFRFQKQHRQLRNVNTAYDAAITKLKRAGSRADVLFPKSYIGQVLQAELRTAERYQEKLQLFYLLLEKQGPLSMGTVDGQAIQKRTVRPLIAEEIVKSVRLPWQNMADQWHIPKEYWPTLELPPFSADSESVWWRFIWSQLIKKRSELLPLLRESGRGRAEAKTSRLYLKHFFKQFRQHWDALIRAREAGFF